MFIKDSTFKKINIAYIILTSLIGLVLIYGIINTMVSLKYETEKGIIDLHINPASDYIKQTLELSYEFLAYVLFNILYLLLMGHAKIKKTRQWFCESRFLVPFVHTYFKWRRGSSPFSFERQSVHHTYWCMQFPSLSWKDETDLHPQHRSWRLYPLWCRT